MDVNEQVWMYHAGNEDYVGTGGYAQVLPETFETAYKDKGWVLQDPPQDEVVALDELTSAQVHAPEPAMVYIFFPTTGGFAQVQEDTFADTWEPQGWVRAPLAEDGTPMAPSDWVPPAELTSGTDAEDTSKEDPSPKSSKKE